MMKKLIKRVSGLLMAGLLMTTGCTKDFEIINTNPTVLTPLNFDPNTLLPSIMLSHSGSATNNIVLASNIVQIMANSATTVDLKMTTGDKYLDMDTNNWMQDVFTNGYTGQVKLVIELLELTRDKPQYSNLHQVGRLVKALVFQRITDAYGDVPYFEAGKAYHERIFYPKYDKQELIYADLLKEVEEATNALNAAGDKPTADEMYKGDIEKWKRFGHSLLLRIAMRMVKVNEPAAKAAALKAVGKTMTGNSDNAFVRGSGADRTNTNNANSSWLLGDSGYNSWYLKWSKTFIDYLRNNNDPRLAKIARTNVWINQVGSSVQTGSPNGDPAVQKGLPNGLNETTNNNGFSMYYDPSWVGTVGDPTGLNRYSSQNPDMIRRDAPTFFFTYAESEFLLAEAATRWGADFGSAKTHYDNAVIAAMTYLSQYTSAMGISAADANAYLAAHPFDATRALEMINTQYWAEAATTMNFFEAWFNWRRSGYPVLTPVNYPGNITGGTIPRRYSYPVGEAATNAENLAAAQAALSGGDTWAARVWWDK